MIEIYGPPLAPPVEYSRWLLERMELPHCFTPAAAGVSAFRSWLNNVPIELPLLFIDGKPHGGFREAFRCIHGELAAEAPNPQPASESGFADVIFAELFPQAVRCFYRTMLEAPVSLKPMATHGVPFLHRLIVQIGYPLWRRVMAGGLKLAQTSLAEDEAAINRTFALVADRLGERPFLAGERPGADDLLFAVAASPVILPTGHPQPMPQIETLPEPLRASVQRYRATAAGQLALRTYRFRAYRSS